MTATPPMKERRKTRSRRGQASWKFFYEWVIVATFPITLPLLIIFLLTKSPPEIALPTVAISGYAIAITYAFLFNLEADHWQDSGSHPRELLGRAFRSMRLLIVIFSAIFIALAALVDDVPVLASYIQSGIVFLWSFNFAVAAVVLAAASVIFRPYRKQVTK
ncbi:hypothetical protein G3T36_08180 [Diaminobutyricibacter tongyongensis]|uniref:Uncharacterized protein n=1 Tax=Leifsonia tongyongensis TaxID=1268043 RepID=A0A6L9XWR1_9MICO|nr:hypothetical protein [Diaminobutyricibacter tongyongensis]NEN05849.1 hypothetical protein [Diaminobutyricibacter tongyongensis]